MIIIIFNIIIFIIIINIIINLKNINSRSHSCLYTVTH